MVALPRKRLKRDWWERGDGKRQAKTWTPDRFFRLVGGIEDGKSDEQIADDLGTTATSVRLARKRAGLGSVTAMTLNTRSVAKMLGVGCAKTITTWIERGWLRGRRGPRRGGNRQWVIKEEDLLEFLANPDHWHRWEASRIADPELREWAHKLPKPRYLTTREVADRLFVTHTAVNNWIHRGILPAVRHGNWMIPESALEGFVPPGQVSRRWSRFTPQEDARLQDLHDQGSNFREIAKALNRSVAGVQRRWNRLQRDGVVAS